MRRIWIAIKAFFLALFKGDIARQIDLVLQGQLPTALPEPRPAPAHEAPRPAPAPVPPARSEALTLLATLQREARFVDFLQENLTGYADAQIGAAAREVHRDCGAVVRRLFDLQPVLAEPEGSPVDVHAGFDSGRLRLTGAVSGAPPYRGQLVHHGWEAAKCEMPVWSGSSASARVVAPAEIEIR